MSWAMLVLVINLFYPGTEVAVRPNRSHESLMKKSAGVGGFLYVKELVHESASTIVWRMIEAHLGRVLLRVFDASPALAK